MLNVLVSTLALAPFSGEFTMHRAMDSATGKTAYRYLLPTGWKTTDTVKWNLASKTERTTWSSTMSSPDGQTKIEILPIQLSPFQVKNGNLTGALPPETATKALDAVLSNSHPGVQNANLVVRKDFDVPCPFQGEGLKSKGLVGILEVSFEQGGQPTTELLSVTEYEASQSGEGGAVQGLWMLSNGYTLTCVGPVTEAAYKTFGVVVASNRIDPTWYAIEGEVDKRSQSGTVDLKAVVASVKGLPSGDREGYVQSLSLHEQSTAQIIPKTIYPGLTDVVTFDGSIGTFKGVHVWMKKPDDYFVSESPSGPPGSGWQEAKAAS